MSTMPNTKEQIEQNRKFVENELQRLYEIASKSNLMFACIIHWAPLSECLKSRVAFFEERYEAHLWLEQMEETYTKLEVPFETYYF